MSTASARDPSRLTTVGALGLALTLLAGIIRSDPTASRWFATLARWFVEIVFQVTIVSSFVIGMVVIVYSQWKHGRGELTENVQRRTAIGVLAVFVLSFGFPLVIIDDIARVVVAVLGGMGPSVPPRTYFLASLTMFGLVTLCGVVGVVRRRVRLRRV